MLCLSSNYVYLDKETAYMVFTIDQSCHTSRYNSTAFSQTHQELHQAGFAILTIASHFLSSSISVHQDRQWDSKNHQRSTAPSAPEKQASRSSPHAHSSRRNAARNTKLSTYPSTTQMHTKWPSRDATSSPSTQTTSPTSIERNRTGT